MRFLLPLAIAILLFSCGPDDHAGDSEKKTIIDTNLRLPTLVAGMPVDTMMASLRISKVFEFKLSDTTGSNPYEPTILVEFDSTRNSEVVNVYADSLIVSDDIDSILNVYCTGKDLRLIGINNGQELAIPFHTLHRFKPVTDTLGRSEFEFHEMFVEEYSVQVNEMSLVYESPEKYFRAFYGDAYNPIDSNYRLPDRERGRQIIEGLMFEASGWDDTDIKKAKDTAQSLAAYNEFVNKLEIYDKVGSYCILRESVMDCLPVSVTWGRLMQVFGEHYATVSSLRESAKKYLSDKIANEGGDPATQFTDEDLRLLYPDRLRWNGRISGTQEHRYDPGLLAEFVWVPDLHER